jgi:hypothetical protein
VATTVGYGPRFLHSTGQLHNGGGDNGVFVQFTASEGEDLPIPGERYGFRVLEAAQALGDYEALASRGRPVLRVGLGADVDAGLEQVLAVLAPSKARAAAARPAKRRTAAKRSGSRRARTTRPRRAARRRVR